MPGKGLPRGIKVRTEIGYYKRRGLSRWQSVRTWVYFGRPERAGVRGRVSGVRVQVADFRLQISDFRFQITDLRFQIPDYRSQIPDFRLQISDSRFQIAGFQISGGWRGLCFVGDVPVISQTQRRLEVSSGPRRLVKWHRHSCLCLLVRLDGHFDHVCEVVVGTP